MIERQIRKQEHEYIARELANLAEKVDSDSVKGSREDIQKSLVEEVKAEGLVREEEVPY